MVMPTKVPSHWKKDARNRAVAMKAIEFFVSNFAPGKHADLKRAMELYFFEGETADFVTREYAKNGISKKAFTSLRQDIMLKLCKVLGATSVPPSLNDFLEERNLATVTFDEICNSIEGDPAAKRLSKADQLKELNEKHAYLEQQHMQLKQDFERVNQENAQLKAQVAGMVQRVAELQQAQPFYHDMDCRMTPPSEAVPIPPVEESPTPKPLVNQFFMAANPFKTNYAKKGRLGQGAFGTVFLCYARAAVVAKDVDITGKVRLIERIRVEADILFKLRHRHLLECSQCYLYDREDAPGNVRTVVTFISPLMSGGSLDALIYQGKVVDGKSVLARLLGLQDVATILRDVLEGVAFLHERGFLHRDLKPANILLDANAIVKVADFGWAGHFSPNDLRFTVCGTAVYVAPEVANNYFARLYPLMAQDPRVDTWSIGKVAKEMVEYKRPSPPNFVHRPEHADRKVYNGDVMRHVLAGQHAYDELIWNMVLPPNSDDFRDFLSCCLRFHPEHRWHAKHLLQHPFLLNCTPDRKSLQSALKIAMMHRKKAGDKN